MNPLTDKQEAKVQMILELIRSSDPCVALRVQETFPKVVDHWIPISRPDGLAYVVLDESEMGQDHPYWARESDDYIALVEYREESERGSWPVEWTIRRVGHWKEVTEGGAETLAAAMLEAEQALRKRGVLIVGPDCQTTQTPS